MKRTLWIMVFALVIAVAMPAAAGEKHHKKCDGNVEDCLAKMQQKIEKKAWLGIEMDTNDDGRYAITRVVPKSPAAKAGFEKGDVLMVMNGVDYNPKEESSIKKAWTDMSPGSTAKFVVLRQGGKVKLKAQLDHVPHDLMAQWIGEHMLKSHLEAPTKVAGKK